MDNAPAQPQRQHGDHRNGHRPRQEYHHSNVMMGVSHFLKLAGSLSPLLILEFVKEPTRPHRWIRSVNCYHRAERVALELSGRKVGGRTAANSLRYWLTRQVAGLHSLWHRTRRTIFIDVINGDPWAIHGSNIHVLIALPEPHVRVLTPEKRTQRRSSSGRSRFALHEVSSHSKLGVPCMAALRHRTPLYVHARMSTR